MHWFRHAIIAALVAAATFSFQSLLPAQEKKVKFEKARITTVDGVDLAGYFYPAKKKSPPTVLLLHSLGEDSKKKNWANFAEYLQDEGFAVLAFDFRGHGNSTTISEPEKFWTVPWNQRLKGKKKDEIEFKNIDKGYYTAFCNDIAAARAWLDRKNDTGAVNTSNLILIGADTGATLGAIWLNSECHRHRLNTIVMGMFMNQVPDQRQEAKDVIAAVWLSISPTLGSQGIYLGRTLAIAAKQNATPMVFMYGDGDVKSKDLANTLAKDIKGKDKTKYPYTDAVRVEGNNTKLKGEGLLLKSLETDKSIVTYLNGVLEDKNQEWVEREYRKTEFVWRLPGGQNYVPAKQKMGGDPNNLFFDSYQKFR